MPAGDRPLPSHWGFPLVSGCLRGALAAARNRAVRADKSMGGLGLGRGVDSAGCNGVGGAQDRDQRPGCPVYWSTNHPVVRGGGCCLPPKQQMDGPASRTRAARRAEEAIAGDQGQPSRRASFGGPHSGRAYFALSHAAAGSQTHGQNAPARSAQGLDRPGVGFFCATSRHMASSHVTRMRRKAQRLSTAYGRRPAGYRAAAARSSPDSVVGSTRCTSSHRRCTGHFCNRRDPRRTALNDDNGTHLVSNRPPCLHRTIAMDRWCSANLGTAG